MNKLRITYNNAMRRLFNLHFRCSASEMFANCDIHSMDEMRRTCIWGVLRKLATSVNQGDTILTMMDVLKCTQNTLLKSY